MEFLEIGKKYKLVVAHAKTKKDSMGYYAMASMEFCGVVEEIKQGFVYLRINDKKTIIINIAYIVMAELD